MARLYRSTAEPLFAQKAKDIESGSSVGCVVCEMYNENQEQYIPLSYNKIQNYMKNGTTVIIKVSDNFYCKLNYLMYDESFSRKYVAYGHWIFDAETPTENMRYTSHE